MVTITSTPSVEAIVRSAPFEPQTATIQTPGVRNGVQLITYADRFGGGGLSTIGELLNGPLAGAFTGVHLLPFYAPYDGADAGFDPVDHRAVDRRLGDWDDIRSIASTHDVTADLIVNHISDASAEFTDFLQRGNDSAFAGVFLEYGAVFPEGATEEDLLAIYRPRPGLPFTPVTLADGSRRLMWTTFTPHQIDLDVSHSRTLAYFHEVIDRLHQAGVGQVRLDAIGYAVKTRGTSCFMTADTFRFIEESATLLRSLGMESLLEVHAHYSHQIRGSALADRVYDFALPPLVLHALSTGSAVALRKWLEMSPRNVITVLDTHDGIGVVDVGPEGALPGLLTPSEIDALIERIHLASRGQSRLATGSAASNLDVYQVNCTYLSALGGDENRYLLARLIQFLCPGVPQVYYAGLLAAANDMDLLASTGVGRDINRPHFGRRQIEEQLERPVVRRLLALARFRSTHQAFAGTFQLDDSAAHELRLRWEAEAASIEAHIDVAEARFIVHHASSGVQGTFTDWDAIPQPAESV